MLQPQRIGRLREHENVVAAHHKGAGWARFTHSRIAFLRHDLAPSIGKNSDKVKDTPTFLYRELEGKPHIYGAQWLLPNASWPKIRPTLQGLSLKHDWLPGLNKSFPGMGLIVNILVLPRQYNVQNWIPSLKSHTRSTPLQVIDFFHREKWFSYASYPGASSSSASDLTKVKLVS
jgi:hypothetical protein